MIATKALLTTDEMATILSISKWHLIDLEREGRISSIRLGRSVRYDPQQVIEELKGGTRRK